MPLFGDEAKGEAMPKGKRRVRQAEIVGLFATRLRDARISRGMTQAELARQAHVTMSYIWRLESASVAPGIDLVDRLARALGTTAADLLATTSPDPISVLRDQSRRLFESIFASADRDDFLAINPVLARFNARR
jgi:transcriptional regulator with XRE-family HTH domain